MPCTPESCDTLTRVDVGIWECPDGHREVAGVFLGSGVHSLCCRCDQRLTRVHVSHFHAPEPRYAAESWVLS